MKVALILCAFVSLASAFIIYPQPELAAPLLSAENAVTIDQSYIVVLKPGVSNLDLAAHVEW